VLCSIVGHGSSAPLIMLASAVPVPGALAGLFGKRADPAPSADERTPLLGDAPAVHTNEHISGRAYTAMGDPDEHEHRSRIRGESRARRDEEDDEEDRRASSTERGAQV
jgi:hypothetical protein